MRPLPPVLQAYHTGGRVPYGACGADPREGQAAINYRAFAHQRAREWLPTMSDVHGRLLAGLLRRGGFAIIVIAATYAKERFSLSKQ